MSQDLDTLKASEERVGNEARFSDTTRGEIVLVHQIKTRRGRQRQHRQLAIHTEPNESLAEILALKQTAFSNEAILRDSFSLALVPRLLELGEYGLRKAFLEYSKEGKLVTLTSRPFQLQMKTGSINGLKNMGNSCYMNSTIQALAASSHFIEYLRQTTAQKDLIFNEFTNEPLNYKIFDLIQGVNGHKPMCIQPRAVLGSLAERHKQFRPTHGSGYSAIGREQHDAQEFLQALLDCCVEDSQIEKLFPSCFRLEDIGQLQTCLLQEFAAEESSSINSFSGMIQVEKVKSSRVSSTLTSISPLPFCGWIGSILQCTKCQVVRPVQNTPFFDLPIVPTSVTKQIMGATARERPTKGTTTNEDFCTLEECLEDFTSVERVTDVQCWACTLVRETESLAEDVALLNDAIESLSSRVSLQDVDKLGVLRNEVEEKAKKLSILRHISVEDTDAIEDTLRDMNENQLLPLEPQREDAFKSLLVTRLPSILCLHLQRKHYDPQRNQLVKTNQFVKFPEILNMAPYCENPSTMDENQHFIRDPVNFLLVAVIEHIGNAFGGHYICYRRDPASNCWLMISDSVVRSCTWDHIRRCQAYMLLYEAL